MPSSVNKNVFLRSRTAQPRVCYTMKHTQQSTPGSRLFSYHQQCDLQENLDPHPGEALNDFQHKLVLVILDLIQGTLTLQDLSQMVTMTESVKGK